MGHGGTFGYAGGEEAELSCPYATYDRQRTFDAWKTEPVPPIPNEETYSYTYDEFAWGSYSYDNSSSYDSSDRRKRARKLQSVKGLEKVKGPLRHSKKFKVVPEWEGWGK
jgi:hypothetical protein